MVIAESLWWRRESCGPRSLAQAWQASATFVIQRTLKKTSRGIQNISSFPGHNLAYLLLVAEPGFPLWCSAGG